MSLLYFSPERKVSLRPIDRSSSLQKFRPPSEITTRAGFPTIPIVYTSSPIRRSPNQSSTTDVWQQKFIDIEKRLKTLEDSRGKQSSNLLVSRVDDTDQTELRRQVHELTQQNQKLRNMLQQRGDVGQQQQYIMELERKNNELDENMRSLHDQVKLKLADLDKTIQEQHKDLQDSQVEKASLLQCIDKLNAQLKALDHEKAQIDAQRTDLVNKIITIEKRLIQLEDMKDDYDRKLKERDDQIRSLEQDVEQYKNDLNDRENEENEQRSEWETREETYISEVNTWKTRFIDLNKEYHNQQEQLYLVQAELDQIKKGQANQIKKSTVLKVSSTVDSSRRPSAINSNAQSTIFPH